MNLPVAQGASPWFEYNAEETTPHKTASCPKANSNYDPPHTKPASSTQPSYLPMDEKEELEDTVVPMAKKSPSSMEGFKSANWDELDNAHSGYQQLQFGKDCAKGNAELESKLDYLISMLENQREYKTSNEGEEIVLYLFLGVFIIYVIDSFSRVVKYTR